MHALAWWPVLTEAVWGLSASESRRLSPQEATALERYLT
jgi:hypothetical protein